jgi:hypothetical protein
MYDILDICNKYKNVLNIIDKSIIDIVSGKEMRGSLDFGDHFDFFPLFLSFSQFDLESINFQNGD